MRMDFCKNYVIQKVGKYRPSDLYPKAQLKRKIHAMFMPRSVIKGPGLLRKVGTKSVRVIVYIVERIRSIISFQFRNNLIR